jgi:hypothetical protein
MLGLASRTDAVVATSPPRAGQRVGSTRSHPQLASGTAKPCAKRAFVSGVSGVPPYLALIDAIGKAERSRQWGVLVRATASALGQVGQVQQLRKLRLRHHGRDTPEPRETTGTRKPMVKR